MKSLVRTTFLLLIVTLSFRVANAVESDGSPSADQAEGQIAAVSQDQATTEIKQSKALVGQIADLENQIGINSEGPNGLLKALGEKEWLASLDITTMESLQKRINNLPATELGNTEVVTDSGKIDALAAHVRQIHKEAFDLVK